MYRNHIKRVLLVDHDATFWPILNDVLGEGYSLEYLPSVSEAIAALERDGTDVVALSWDDPSAAELLKAASALPLSPPVIVYSWDTRREVALDAVRQGAMDFLTQPLLIQELRFAIDRAYQRTALVRDLDAAKSVIASKHVEGLIGNSKPMERVRELVHKVASVFTTVLVTGESGTGKEVVARAIHDLSPRAPKPFVAFSACALPESLIEDELFGHDKGAFTGAAQTRRGRFEEAQGGTIFLDEIGDLALPLQAKLLRVLQERKMERLGSNTPVALDIRVICATNRDLERMVKEGTFRQDLYFRISVVRVPLPPLRERRDDIPVLAEHFLRRFASAHQKEVRGFTPAFLSALAACDWPGNVRELQNVMESSVVLADGARLGVKDLPPEISRLTAAAEITRGSFHWAVRSFKRELVRSALRLHDGNKLKAAQELQISRCYLHRLLNQLSIEPDSNSELGEAACLAEAPVLNSQIQ